VRNLKAEQNISVRFCANWEELAPDRYAAELGTRRLRRPRQYTFQNGVTKPMRSGAFVQPDDSNPFYINRDRHFEPRTDAFANDPLLHSSVRLLARFAMAPDEASDCDVWVRPFQVLATADAQGQPTPEGLHHDGVTLVTSLLVRRCNAIGAESSLFDVNGHPLLRTTLCEPGTLQPGDNRRTVHGASPIRPLDCSKPAQRDILVITFAPHKGGKSVSPGFGARRVLRRRQPSGARTGRGSIPTPNTATDRRGQCPTPPPGRSAPAFLFRYWRSSRLVFSLVPRCQGCQLPGMMRVAKEHRQS
jgi:hypothetical protein